MAFGFSTGCNVELVNSLNPKHLRYFYGFSYRPSPQNRSWQVRQKAGFIFIYISHTSIDDKWTVSDHTPIIEPLSFIYVDMNGISLHKIKSAL